MWRGERQPCLSVRMRFHRNTGARCVGIVAGCRVYWWWLFSAAPAGWFFLCFVWLFWWCVLKGLPCVVIAGVMPCAGPFASSGVCAVLNVHAGITCGESQHGLNSVKSCA